MRRVLDIQHSVCLSHSKNEHPTICNWWCNGQSAVGVRDATVSRELQICVVHDAYDDCFIYAVYLLWGHSTLVAMADLQCWKQACFQLAFASMMAACVILISHSKKKTLKPHQIGTTTLKCHYSAKQPAKCTAERTGNERKTTIAAAKIRIRYRLYRGKG